MELIKIVRIASYVSAIDDIISYVDHIVRYACKHPTNVLACSSPLDSKAISPFGLSKINSFMAENIS